MLLDGRNCVTKQFGHVVRAAATRPHVHSECVAVPVRERLLTFYSSPQDGARRHDLHGSRKLRGARHFALYDVRFTKRCRDALSRD